MMKRFILAIFISITFIIPVQAAVLFEDDFETLDGTTGLPIVKTGASPVWAWKDPYVPVTNPFGMMYGEGDLYTGTFAIKHGGRGALRLQFDGRQNFCNRCAAGMEKFTVQSSGPSHVVVTAPSANFNTLFATPDTVGRVYNITDRFVRWKGLSTAGNQINLDVTSPPENNMAGAASFSPGDEIGVVKDCPANTIRSDCNLGINYLKNINASHFPVGGTIARRFYIYVPKDTIIPNIGFKLAYLSLKRDGKKFSTWMPFKAIRTGATTINIANRTLYGKFEATGVNFSRDTWYYIEEVFTRESSSSGSDGTYSFYIAKAGQTVTTPLIHRTGIRYGELTAISVIGNWQNDEDAIGSVYIDDVKISTQFNGPVTNDLVALPPQNLN